MESLSWYWHRVQKRLFPLLEESLGPLTEDEREVSAVLELVRIEESVEERWSGIGRPPADRAALARCFVAKMVLNARTTRELISRLLSSPRLRAICGWEWSFDVPSESSFSRSFAEFAASGLAERVHAALISRHEGPRLVGHISRDSTDIAARERPLVRVVGAVKPKRKRGRRKKGEAGSGPSPGEAASRLERQRGQGLAEMLSELPRDCSWGGKRKESGVHYWKGYKLHTDWADGEIPVSCLLTSASVHDSQAAIPLMTLSMGRVVNLYDLMDAAYDAEAIWSHSRDLGHVPIIDRNPRRQRKEEMSPAAQRRYDERTTAERGFSLLKDRFGGRSVRVRGAAKVMSHLMFGILALTAVRLLHLVM